MLTGKLMPAFWKNRNVHITGSGRSVKAKRSFETSEIIDQLKYGETKIPGLETEDVCFEILRKVCDTTSRHDETSLENLKRRQFRVLLISVNFI